MWTRPKQVASEVICLIRTSWRHHQISLKQRHDVISLLLTEGVVPWPASPRTHTASVWTVVPITWPAPGTRLFALFLRLFVFFAVGRVGRITAATFWPAQPGKKKSYIGSNLLVLVSPSVSAGYRAGDTHPTGIHSCFEGFYVEKNVIVQRNREKWTLKVHLYYNESDVASTGFTENPV